MVTFLQSFFILICFENRLNLYKIFSNHSKIKNLNKLFVKKSTVRKIKKDYLKLKGSCIDIKKKKLFYFNIILFFNLF